MKKILFLSIHTFLICIPIKVNATTKSEIPESMPENTLIRYVSDTKYEMINDNLERKQFEYNENDYNEIIPTSINSLNGQTVIETYPTPCKDMFDQYGTDGLVNKIYAPKNISLHSNITLVDSTYAINNSKDNLQLFGVDDPHYSLIAQWGSYPNYLWKGISNYDYLYYGKGRATTFSDSIGQADHTLVKGNVATKLAYDNCKVGTIVKVYLPINGSSSKKTVTMTKWDVGSMTNAIVDIWKTGVSYWGYTYSSKLSIDNAVINHD